ncbi:hypothetical protein H9P43_008992 [Blastocladiella emersonii ATCC 22665]|nr:hypothetical protein H9P43_008992 [Blastocladiella emersonii ATCC 22665]
MEHHFHCTADTSHHGQSLNLRAQPSDLDLLRINNPPFPPSKLCPRSPLNVHRLTFRDVLSPLRTAMM